MKWLRALLFCIAVFTATVVMIDDTSYSESEADTYAFTYPFQVIKENQAVITPSALQGNITPLLTTAVLGDRFTLLSSFFVRFLALFTMSVLLQYLLRKVNYVRQKSLLWQERYSCYRLCRMLD